MDRRRKEGKEREERGAGGKEGAGEESEGGRLMSLWREMQGKEGRSTDDESVCRG